MRAKKINYLMENGLPSKFLINLSDKQVDSLYDRYISEATVNISSKNPNAAQIANDMIAKGVTVTMTEKEIDEDDQTDFDLDNATGVDPYEDPNPEGNEKGPSQYGVNPKNDETMDDGMDILENKKKSKYNPWAICTSQLGKKFKTTERSEWSPKQKAKYERCVKDVKSSINEGKDPYETLLENHILELVENNVRPGMTKQDIINTVKENMQMVSSKKLDKPLAKLYTSKKTSPMEAAEPVVKPKTAPPKTKPGVKPSKPNPYQPPKETPKEKPKAQDYKSMFISALNQLLGK